nr:hypothetical protein [Candidatus Sigynarchaeum springense]
MRGAFPRLHVFHVTLERTRIPILLIANKSDLEREATSADVQDCAKQIGAIDMVETCAKSGDNVNKAFMTLTKSILKRK